MKRNPQLKFFKIQKSDYGGILRNTRKGRAGPRPLATRHTTHLVLRSSWAHEKWSFYKFYDKIHQIVAFFGAKYGVKIISLVIVGNHLHFHIQLGNRFAYERFIRAITSAISMAVTGMSRWKSFEMAASEAGIKRNENQLSKNFWDYRPFTRIVQGFKALLALKDYFEINRLEEIGFKRSEARWIIKNTDYRTADFNTA